MNDLAEFRDYFEAELSALRDDAVEFGEDNPNIAQALALGLVHGRSRDPHVELLLQSFAFLTARLRRQLDRDRTLVPNALMAQLYPHLEAPIPTLLIAELTPRPGKPSVLEAGRELHAAGSDEVGRAVTCRMSTTCDALLVPLRVSTVQAIEVNSIRDLDPAVRRRVQSVLKVRLASTLKDPLRQTPIDRLRFYIDVENTEAFRLYEMLAVQLVGVSTLRADGRCGAIVAPDAALSWRGFDDGEAAVGRELCTHPGYRLLQEYFAFPEKFLFFDLAGVPFHEAGVEDGRGGEYVEVLFLLGDSIEKRIDLKDDLLRLNCVPVINLFRQRIEPVALDHAQYEYRLSADYANHRFAEIYRVERLEAQRPGEPVRPLAPYFSLGAVGQLEEHDYFYIARRVESDLRSVPGTETWVSFLDAHFSVEQPADQTIGGLCTCTQRRLAEQLRVGHPLRLQGPGAVESASTVSRPTPYQAPALLGGQPWALVSQLLLNHLSLEGTDEALAALKSLLRLHVGAASVMGPRQIDSLTRLEVRPALFEARRRPRPDVPDLVDGLDITVHVDRHRFDDSGHAGSPVLLAEVLRRFFALYAAVNTVTRTSLETNDVKGKVKTWRPLAGEQIVL